MKTHLYGAAAALLILAGTASAQTVVITPEQETVIREYVVTQEVQPVTLPSEIELSVGTALPEDIELRVLEAPDVDVEYQYVVVDGRTVLVEPETREIVHIIEQ